MYFSTYQLYDIWLLWRETIYKFNKYLTYASKWIEINDDIKTKNMRNKAKTKTKKICEKNVNEFSLWKLNMNKKKEWKEKKAHYQVKDVTHHTVMWIV